MAYVGKTESGMDIAVFREHTKQKNMLMFTETARHSIPEKKIYVTHVTLSYVMSDELKKYKYENRILMGEY
jgi:hypothetical protein